MVDYDKDVEEDAVSLLLDNDEMFKEAIKEDVEFDRNDIGELDTVFHETIVDRSYSPEDAVFILENCENEETDSGLWEGMDSWRDELAARAAWSFSNDVWFKAEEMYNELKEKYQELKDTYEHWINTVNSIELNEDITTEDAIDKIIDGLKENFADSGIPFDKEQFINAVTNEEIPEDFLVDIIFDDFKFDNTTQPIDAASEEALHLLNRWIKLGKEAGWWSGYPLGHSYIDSRCGSGHGMADIKDFVDFDHEVAHKLPGLSGKRTEDILIEIERLEKIHGKS